MPPALLQLVLQRHAEPMYELVVVGPSEGTDDGQGSNDLRSFDSGWAFVEAFSQYPNEFAYFHDR